MSIPLIVFGDSIMWGQGLNQADKFSTLVYNRLVTYLSAQGISVDLHVFAHSGATIWPDSTDGNAPLWGEVPVSAPCIVTQVATAGSQLGAAAQQPCLVLVDGGINDTKLTNIFTIDPTIWNKPDWIAKITTQDVGPRMQDLLTHIFNTFPQAFVIVTSYYQLVSQHSVGVTTAEVALGAFLGHLFPGAIIAVPFLMSGFAEQCRAFAQASQAGLSNAVTTFNAMRGQQRVFLAVPPFGPHNALGADVPYVWMGADDPLVGLRTSWAATHIGQGPAYTPIASIGHPNVQGARVYANAINRQLAWVVRQLAPFSPPVSQFLPNESWTNGPYYGSLGTFFADVDGDGRADAIVVNPDRITVRRSNGSGFGAYEPWTTEPFYGTRGTFFADVDGDGRADAIVVNDDGVYVWLSTGTGFAPAQNWTGGPYYDLSGRGTYFADVTGDGRADAIVVNDDGVYVRLSTGTGFGPAQNWTGGPYYSSRGTYFADVTGDGRADAIVVNNDTVVVRRSNGARFLPNEDWTHGPYYGSEGMAVYFADVTGDGCADAIVINRDRVTVRRAH